MNPLRPTTPDDTDTLVAITDATGLFRPIEVEALREVLDDRGADARAAARDEDGEAGEAGIGGETWHGPSRR